MKKHILFPVDLKPSRVAVQNSLQEDAKKLDMDINFISGQSNASGLMNQSKFADLAIISKALHRGKPNMKKHLVAVMLFSPSPIQDQLPIQKQSQKC